MSRAIEFNHVWKKLRRGEKFNAIRDAVPNMVRRVLRREVVRTHLENREFWALNDVSFNVEHGEVVGIIGPNGAGKSTILKLLSKIMEPTQGTMAINGRLSALIEVTAGFHPELTGRENVYLNGTILGMKRQEIDSKFDEIVEFSGLKEFIDTPVKRYSSGMFSRLGFSVAAHVNPDVLLVDEVLAVGDIAFQSKCAQKMRELLNSGVTIVLVSHNLTLIQSLCKRTILLNKGQVMKEGPPQEVIPFYEDLIYRQKEEEFRHKVESGAYQVKIQTQEAISINKVTLSTGSSSGQNTYEVFAPISLDIEFEAYQTLDDPVFLLDIVRADGVLCCASNSRTGGVKFETLKGKDALHIDLSQMNLGPGIYLAKISVWDKDMLHPYIIRNKDFFKVVNTKADQRLKGIFLPTITWSA